MCAGPYKRGVEEWPCGKCLPCRMNKRRLWTARLMLESQLHARACFVTLTYRDDSLPGGNTVVPRHLTLFLKLLRRNLEPIRIRFFAVGEYGGRTQRPHYHAILFGVDRAADIQNAWPHGHIHVGTLTEQSASYVVSYTLKLMTARSDPRLKGRHPEFTRMSRRPGIGFGAMEAMADALTTKAGCEALIRMGDVVSEFRMDGRKYPLGRYLRNSLRVLMGRSAGEPLELRNERLKLLRDELSLPGAFAQHEGKREATREKARARAAISESKKGFGL